MMKIKALLKNKYVIGGTAAFLVVAVVITIALLIPKSPNLATAPDESSSVSVSPPVVSMPESTGSEASSHESNISSGNQLVSDVHVGLDQTSSKSNGGGTSGNKDNSSKAKQPEQPVTPVEPPEQPSSQGGTDNGGGNTPSPYSCGSPNHHCEGPETHAYILNLELEGCPYCSSHSCPSFYATDQWGGAITDVTKCPNYDIKQDPIKYCQVCGKKNGDGSNGTCTQFTDACSCPLCGEHVEAWTCHTCK